MGTALLSQGKLEDAVSEYREAVRLQPDNVGAYSNLGAVLHKQGKIDEAINAFREAIRIKPDYAEARNNLGAVLKIQGRLDEAITELREAIRLKPDYVFAHYALGNIFLDQRKFEGAINEYRAVTRVQPENVDARCNLGIALEVLGQREAAIAEYREAIRIKPDNADVIWNLGLTLGRHGLFRESLEALERGHELGSHKPDWPSSSEPAVRYARQLVELEAKLPALLKGELQPKDAAERLALVDLCYKMQRHSAATRFADEAFSDTPSLVLNLAKSYRFNAACSACLAGTGTSKDDPLPDEASRVKLREKALGWLQADLSLWEKVLEGGTEPARKQAVVQTMARWKEDSDLAGARDETALAKLPEIEREAFRVFWAE